MVGCNCVGYRGHSSINVQIHNQKPNFIPVRNRSLKLSCWVKLRCVKEIKNELTDSFAFTGSPRRDREKKSCWSTSVRTSLRLFLFFFFVNHKTGHCKHVAWTILYTYTPLVWCTSGIYLNRGSWAVTSPLNLRPQLAV